MPVTTPSSQTTRSVILRALRLLGVISPGQPTPDDMLQDSLDALDGLLGSYNTDRQKIFTEKYIDTISTAGGNFTANGIQYFTIGPGGDWNVERPVLNLDRANLLYQTTPFVRIPLSIYNFDQFASVQTPTIANVPNALFFDRRYDSQGRARVYIVNNANRAYPIELWYTQGLTLPSDLDTVLVQPPGYWRMECYALAKEIAPEFKANWTETLEASMQEAIRNIDLSNLPFVVVPSALASFSSRKQDFNYLTGEPY